MMLAMGGGKAGWCHGSPGPTAGRVPRPCWTHVVCHRPVPGVGTGTGGRVQGHAFSLAWQPPVLGDTCLRVTFQQGPGAAIQLCKVLWARRSRPEARPLPGSGFLAALPAPVAAARLVLPRQGLGYPLLCPPLSQHPPCQDDWGAMGAPGGAGCSLPLISL